MCLYCMCIAPWPGRGASSRLPCNHPHVTLALDKLTWVSEGRFLPHERENVEDGSEVESGGGEVIMKQKG